MSRELQIQIDDAYACPGSCAGCVLNVYERKGSEPSMALDTLLMVHDSINNYIKEIRNEIDTVNITYGIADHFLFSSDYLVSLYRKTAKILKDNGLSGSSIFMSSSFIGKQEKIFNKLKEIKKAKDIEGVDFIPVAVLDPKALKYQKFGNEYKENILQAKELFNKVDLSINLSSEAIEHITPIELFEFAKENTFDEVTINWTPTKDNISMTYFNLKNIKNFLLEFALLIKNSNISSSYTPVLEKTINSVMCDEDNIKEIGKINFIKNITFATILKSIHINENGDLFPKFEAIGDVPHSPRFGYKELGNLKNDTIFNLINKNKNLITKRVVEPIFKNKSCGECKYNIICSSMGYHIYTNVVGNTKKEKGCPHVAYDLIDYFFKIEKEKDEKKHL